MRLENRRGRRLLGVTATAATVAVALCGTTGAGAQDAGTDLDVSPTTAPDGLETYEITVSGSGCTTDLAPDAEAVHVDATFLTLDANGEPRGFGYRYPVEPDPSGSWTAELVVPGAGLFRVSSDHRFGVTATCDAGPISPGGDHEVLIEYELVEFVVTPVAGASTTTTTAPVPASPSTPVGVPVAPQAQAATPVLADPTYTG
jgi:hypothetical protein